MMNKESGIANKAAEEGEPVAHLRWWACQINEGHGNIGHEEGYEVCEKGELSDDKSPAFPVYASQVAADRAARAGVSDSWSGAVEWFRNNYQDHANIASLCDAMTQAAPSAPVGAVPSIDTNQFADLLVNLWNAPSVGARDERAKAMIAHIDQYIASQVRAALTDLEAQLAECAALPAKWAAAAGDADGRALNARDAALEEAAKQCEDIYSWRGAFSAGLMDKPTLKACAAAIRSRKLAPSISHSGEGEKGGAA